MMTRQDYIKIAAAVKDTRTLVGGEYAAGDNPHPDDTLDDVTRAIANALAEDNPRFDRARFLKACGTL